MLVLTPENKVFDMNTVGDFIPDAMYCSLNLTTLKDADYYFHNILGTVNFSSIAAELQIGDYTTQVPINWQILIGDDETGMVETVRVDDLLSINDPYAFVYNPITSKYIKFLPVKVKNIFTINIRWQIPMIGKSNMLVLPIEYKESPNCIMIADEIDRFPEFIIGDF